MKLTIGGKDINKVICLLNINNKRTKPIVKRF